MDAYRARQRALFIGSRHGSRGGRGGDGGGGDGGGGVVYVEVVTMAVAVT